MERLIGNSLRRVGRIRGVLVGSLAMALAGGACVSSDSYHSTATTEMSSPMESNAKAMPQEANSMDPQVSATAKCLASKILNLYRTENANGGLTDEYHDGQATTITIRKASTNNGNPAQTILTARIGVGLNGQEDPALTTQASAAVYEVQDGSQLHQRLLFDMTKLRPDLGPGWNIFDRSDQDQQRIYDTYTGGSVSNVGALTPEVLGSGAEKANNIIATVTPGILLECI